MSRARVRSRVRVGGSLHEKVPLLPQLLQALLLMLVKLLLFQIRARVRVRWDWG